MGKSQRRKTKKTSETLKDGTKVVYPVGFGKQKARKLALSVRDAVAKGMRSK